MKLSDLNTYTKAKIRNLPTTVLESVVERTRDLYTRGKSILTDEKYDIVEDELRARDPKNPLLKRVGAKVTGRSKVKLPYPLYSLSKFTPSDSKSFDAWLRQYPGPYVISYKEDGASLELIYDKKKLSKVYSRGDGTFGQDITHLAKYLNVPKTVSVDHLAVRAEIAMTDQAFAKYAAGDYENPRNLVAGLTNRLKGDFSMLKHADVLAYEVIEPRIGPSKGFAALKRMGFTCAPHEVVSKIDLEMLAEKFTQARKISPHAIDGLVVENNDINKRPPAGTHSPDYAFAFKDQSKDDSARVKILSIDWEETKHGKLMPVIIIPPTRLAGVTVQNVTGHNAFFIENGFRSNQKKLGLPVKPLGKGAVIRIVRRGDVIPHVVEVIKGVTKPDLPKVAFRWDATGVNILMEGSSDLVRDKRITAFFSTLGVDGVKLGVVQKLTAAGMTSIIKILRADVEDFLNIPGFKRRSAEKLVASIRAKTSKVTLPVLMDGSGHFGQGFGTRRLQQIVSVYPKLMTTFPKLTAAQIVAKVVAIHGFQTKTANAFAKGFPKFVKWLRISKLTPVMPKAVKVTGSAMQDQAVCFTGYRDKALEAAIVKNGGSIATGVNKNTTILVYAPGKESSKLTKARDLGIKIMTPDQFKAKYKL